jgi:hypothetical protein
MGPEQSRSKMVSLQDFDLIRVGLGLGKRKMPFKKVQNLYCFTIFVFCDDLRFCGDVIQKLVQNFKNKET